METSTDPRFAAQATWFKVSTLTAQLTLADTHNLDLPIAYLATVVNKNARSRQHHSKGTVVRILFRKITT